MFKYQKSILSNQGRSLLFSILFSLAKGWAAIADIVATVAMCFWLTSSKTGIKETNSILSQLMKFVVQRGILVTTIQVLLLVSFYAAPGSLAWFALHMNVTKLYANTFFAMLNGRSHLRERQTGAVISAAYQTSANQTSFMDPVKTDVSSPRPGQSVQDSASPYTLEKLELGQTIYETGPGPRQSRESASVMPTVTKSVVVSEM
ncbi:hypothetical protein CC1G_07981 [Coprinopsis cinerea okayama7|uniref:DUF6534 domain-containing protein n=1 Tax=Coprinopsis cinerea (strain Okayama-7 / 130 / ATCC MYA-4618 / FGSC 9003) TaxID=240176 RepID=A8P243_COPC7|nr:hypothetical protein CC1G_07981 [Coprinopsis cinerea okayama7\|eukprot:XP_001838240.1 hypothetical protein CC1G_07981 [Coprinopsis cinerea okayama7\